MSLETWLDEFYPVEATSVSAEDAVKHSLLKWEGYRPANMIKHGMTKERTYTCIKDSDDKSFYAYESSCALCVHFTCDDDCPLVHCADEYREWVQRNDPEPMISKLKAILEKELRMRDGIFILEAQAKFVYNAARLAAFASGAPIVPAEWDDREDEFKAQFLDVIERQMGDQRSHSPEELHGSWVQSYISMGWKYGEKYNPAERFILTWFLMSVLGS